jgi:alternate signal-mediated exported protein, CPF_0494 family
MKKINKKTKVAISAMLAITLIVATWAYFTSESKIDNKFNTESNSVETIEKFTPDQKIEPGQTIDKEVGVKNTGNYGLVVRIKLEEAWARGGTDFLNLSSEDAGAFNDAIDSAVKDSGDKVTSSQVANGDGDTAGDETVMYKNLLGLTDGTWTKGDDGYYYYNTILKPKNSTSLLFDKITFAGDADLGIFDSSSSVIKYSQTAETDIDPLQADYDTALAAYEADEDDEALKVAFEAAEAALEGAYAWSATKPADPTTITYQKVSSTIDPTAAGYSDADYTLTVITQVCQATEEAVDAEWTGMDAAVKSAWGLQ